MTLNGHDGFFTSPQAALKGTRGRSCFWRWDVCAVGFRVAFNVHRSSTWNRPSVTQGPGIGSVTYSLRVLEALHCMYCAVHSTHTALFSPLADLARFNRARPLRAVCRSGHPLELEVAEWTLTNNGLAEMPTRVLFCPSKAFLCTSPAYQPTNWNRTRTVHARGTFCCWPGPALLHTLFSIAHTSSVQ